MKKLIQPQLYWEAASEAVDEVPIQAGGVFKFEKGTVYTNQCNPFVLVLQMGRVQSSFKSTKKPFKSVEIIHARTSQFSHRRQNEKKQRSIT